ncbi:unnamed protein product [Soboliphyme baturini]|uniref:Ribonucleoside-diphosphate reductase n=1 Tax=Soboliphyme baturini TaxID=241478 RepID=A0A183IBP0_9BILA|nr:unnamed protein product [Soboliphyme baturini]
MEIKANDESCKEMLLIPNPRRFEILPLQYPLIWQHYKRLESSFWTAEDIDFSKDALDFAALNADEKTFLSKILACLICASGTFNESLIKHFSEKIQSTEARCYFGFQIFLENVHYEIYSLLFNVFYPTRGDEVTKLFKEVEQMPFIQMRQQWVDKWIANEKYSYAQRLVALAPFENVFFAGCFAAILSLKKQNIMPGFVAAVEKIFLDQRRHADFACHLYSYFANRPNQTIVEQMVAEAADIEVQLLTESVPVTLIKLNPETMRQFVEYVADCLLEKLEIPKVIFKESSHTVAYYSYHTR